MLGLNGHVALAAAGIAPMVVCDPKEPGGKVGIPVEAREPAVGLHERVLRQVIRQCRVSPRQMAQEMTHGGLVAANQLPERGVVVRDDYAGDQFRISHVRAGSAAADPYACTRGSAGRTAGAPRR